jgi:plastocyanin domain-containing protein
MKNLSKSLLSGIGLLLVLTSPALGQSEPKAMKKVIATVDQDGVQRVSILGGGYFYDPNYIVVKVNVPVELSVRRESGITPHDLIIKAPEAGIDVKVDMGTKPQLITFTPTKPGKYAIYCSKKLIFAKSHREKGMEGVLEVTE